ncbi:MAG: hypothetical protein KC442_24325 [Thermomicrobiales bacterium]|nr:hypothetical protein [Thermomicrobiales bacterium]
MRRRITSHWRASVIGLLLAAGLANLTHAQEATPVDPALEQRLTEIARETAALRGLDPLDNIDDLVLTRPELQQRLPDILTRDLDPAELEAATRALIAIGLLPEGSDLQQLTLELLGDQVAGFYDPLTDEMYVIRDGAFSAEAYYYAHEVVHALQDAYLDPDDLMEVVESDNDDESLAMAALYEGDAVAVSNDYLAAHPDLAFDLMREAGSAVGASGLDRAPAPMVATLVFPYTAGLPFVTLLREDGGWDAVNAAYADMPASTEQVLHPEKYAQRDQPVTLALPTPAEALGSGWREVHQNTLGELQVALLLADLPPGRGFNTLTGSIELPAPARNAAAGWDGDRYALWADTAGQETLVWRTAWDTEQDARAFAAALTRFEEARWGGVFNGESANDIALVTNDVAARILLRGQEVFYVQSPTLALADQAQAALLAAPAPAPLPGPG